MIAEKDKISTRQLFLLFIMIVGSPIIRILPRLVGVASKKAGWITPIFAFIFLIALIYILDGLYKKNKDLNLTSIIFKVFGNVLGRVLIMFYFIWLFVLLSLYIRYFAERMLSSILPNTSIHFYFISILILVFYTARNGLVALARSNEILLIIALSLFFIITGLSLFNVNVTNVLPISTNDLLPILSGIEPILGILGYLTFMFFLGDHVHMKGGFIKLGIKSFALLTIAAVLLLFCTIGGMSYKVVQDMSTPFFSLVKELSLGESFQRFEAVAIAVWTVVDFYIITVIVMALANILKTSFKLSDGKSVVTPIIILAYPFAIFLASNIDQLELMSSRVLIHLNVIFCFVVPLIVLVIGKLRKVV